ncbi:MAG: hypothetical protein J1E62_09330 [Lachnospiraceae bacterium]|nr:hypothetical protein [Lachnospiraceae bacterium]
MNFKENYQREMNELRKPSYITEKVLNEVDREQERYANRTLLKNGATWKVAAAAFAIACVLGLWQHENLIGFAESIPGLFTLSVNNEKDDEFGKINPVNMDVEAFINDAETESLPGEDDNPFYTQIFTSYQEMNQLTKLEFPCADKVSYSEIMVGIEPKYHVGHLSMALSYQGVSYRLNGMFALEGYDKKDWGYGDTGKKEIYEYQDGKNAYFVNSSGEGYKAAYFVEKDILFQLFFIDSNKAQAKKLLGFFGSQE